MDGRTTRPSTKSSYDMIRLRGTFLDEITHDIPSQNWGEEEWARDFDAMKAVGIDTVILIRAGYRTQAVFDSTVLDRQVGMLPAYDDLLGLFLRQAERCGMSLYFGLYDSGRHWVQGEYREEIDLNKAFCREVVDRYGHHDAFRGWYFSHEMTRYDPGILDLYRELSDDLRSLKPGPVMISPYVSGVKQFGGEAVSFQAHAQEWGRILEHLAGAVDIVAFQDGQVPYEELAEYLALHKSLADQAGIASWSNVESFDRDMPIRFLPIAFRHLRYKMEQAAKAGIENLITFEFSHFMSPNSVYPAAHGLYKRYSDWLETQAEKAP